MYNVPRPAYTVLRPYARKFASVFTQTSVLEAVKTEQADITNLVIAGKTLLGAAVSTGNTGLRSDETEAVAYFNYESLANRAWPDGSNDAVAVGTYAIPYSGVPVPEAGDAATCMLKDAEGTLLWGDATLGALAVQFDYIEGQFGCIATVGDPEIGVELPAGYTVPHAYAVLMDVVIGDAAGKVKLQVFGPTGYTGVAGWELPTGTGSGALITVVLEADEPVCWLDGVLLDPETPFPAVADRTNDAWSLTKLYSLQRGAVPLRLGGLPVGIRGGSAFSWVLATGFFSGDSVGRHPGLASSRLRGCLSRPTIRTHEVPNRRRQYSY
jgi:hypothetical protein